MKFKAAHLVSMNLDELELRLEVIREQMALIKASGEIAPPNTWIVRYQVKKASGKIYYYYRLLEATEKRSASGSIQGKVKLYLGNEESQSDLDCKAASERRNQLKVLQRRYDKLIAQYQNALMSKGSSSREEKVDRDRVAVDGIDECDRS